MYSKDGSLGQGLASTDSGGEDQNDPIKRRWPTRRPPFLAGRESTATICDGSQLNIAVAKSSWLISRSAREPAEATRSLVDGQSAISAGRSFSKTVAQGAKPGEDVSKVGSKGRDRASPRLHHLASTTCPPGAVEEVLLRKHNFMGVGSFAASVSESDAISCIQLRRMAPP
jgi:hypothetical protein